MSVKQQTDEPFSKALSKIKRERGLSFRDLAAATKAADPTGHGLSAAHISRVCAGLDPPSAAAIALIATALDLPARYFAEYRLAEARALLDERAPGGLRSALRHLSRLEANLGRSPSRPPTHRARRRAS